MNRRRVLIGAAVALVLTSFAAGVLVSRQRQTASDAPQPAQAAVEQLLTSPLADPTGQPATLARWRGKPLIVNFWATWCPPCLKEMPVFSRLQEKYPNVQFIGIAADKPGNVQAFVGKHSLSYPILVATEDPTALMAALGNNRNGLPFTLSIDTAGRPRHIKLGGLSEAETERIIAELSGR